MRVAIAGAGIIVLAVKPQQLAEVAARIAPGLEPAQTVVSIVAGIKLHSLGLKLNHDRLVRVMPNTPAQVGSGMSVWTAAPEVPAPGRQSVPIAKLGRPGSSSISRRLSSVMSE
jgi:pyrroline-5-carboxylate reductase